MKADGYGHGATACARRGARRRRDVARGRDRGRRPRICARDGIGERLLVMGALTREELELALEADADVVAWREDSLARRPRSPRRTGPRACT